MRKAVRGGEPDRYWPSAAEIETLFGVAIIGGVRASAAPALTGSRTLGVDALWVQA